MKKTVREKLMCRLMDYEKRLTSWRVELEDYSKQGEWAKALEVQNKMDTLKLVIIDIKDILS